MGGHRTRPDLRRSPPRSHLTLSRRVVPPIADDPCRLPRALTLSPMIATEGHWLGRSALLLTLLVPLSGCSLCGNEVLDRSRAPDNSVEVVVCERSCGATTGFSTQASIGESNAGTGNEGGNIFVATTDHGGAPPGKGGGQSCGFGGLTIGLSNWPIIGPLTCGSARNTGASQSAT